MQKRMKIAFAGPSGLGKTTLAHLVADRLKIAHPSTSAGDIFTREDKYNLKDLYGYEGKGHQNVINLSASDPEFGVTFQNVLLSRRAKQIEDNNPVVLDRCPIDNVVYMLTQAGHNMRETQVNEFINRAQLAYLELSHVIMIRYSSDIPFIEDNKSRVPNRYFQQYISDVFGGVYVRYFSHIIGPRVIEIDFWNLEERVKTALAFIEDSTKEFEHGKN